MKTRVLIYLETDAEVTDVHKLVEKHKEMALAMLRMRLGKCELVRLRIEDNESIGGIM